MRGAGLSVVLPAWNEAARLSENVERLVAVLSSSGRPFEILIVDDGSTDDTGGIAAALAARFPEVRALAHARNRGKGSALVTGMRAAHHPVLVLLDADLQIPPTDILPLVHRLEETGSDVAVGSKYVGRGAAEWPLGRRLLSRLYRAVTQLAFRLPLSDTQTGLKVVRSAALGPLLGRLRVRRFAWDLELVVLARRAGHRLTSGPVTVHPGQRASRLTLGGCLRAGVDTAAIFLRDRALAAYAVPPPPRRRRLRVLASADDLGLCRSSTDGALCAAKAGSIRSISILAQGLDTERALGLLLRAEHPLDAGLHLDLLQGRSMGSFLVAALLGRVRPRAALEQQRMRLRAAGISISHVDAHRHAWLLPFLRRDILASLARQGPRGIRSLRPLQPLAPRGVLARLKNLVLLAAATLDRGRARAMNLIEPDGFVGVLEAAAWIQAGALPPALRGKTVEIIAHPLEGAFDLPPPEVGTVRRGDETRAVLERPLLPALCALGAEIVDFEGLTSSGAAEAVSAREETACSSRSSRKRSGARFAASSIRA